MKIKIDNRKICECNESNSMHENLKFRNLIVRVFDVDNCKTIEISLI